VGSNPTSRATFSLFREVISLKDWVDCICPSGVVGLQDAFSITQYHSSSNK